jgi:hypothetical protein
MPVGLGGDVKAAPQRKSGLWTILWIITLSVGPMFWPPFNQLSGLIPTGTTTVMTTMIDEGNVKALPLEDPGGPSLKHFITSRLNPINSIADRVSSCLVRTLHLEKLLQWPNMQRRQNHGLIINALELAKAESTAAWQVNALVDALWKKEKYVHAPKGEAYSFHTPCHGKFKQSTSNIRQFQDYSHQ